MTTLALLFSLLAMSPRASAQALDEIYRNNQGVEQYKKEKHLESYETFLGLTASDPYNPLLLLNLGAALAANGEEEKAAALYKQLLPTLDQKLKTAKSPEAQQNILRVKYAVLYNLGVHFQSIKQPDDALIYYQQALELLPDSKEIKTNIEMMFAGGGNGKGKGDDKQKGKEGEGQGDKPQENQDGKDGKDQKPQPKPDDKSDKDQQKKKGFDQKQMSGEDLERIMDELKQQEQNIRARVNNKAGKSEPNEKEW